MAYTTDDLVARYTAANLGKAPDQATRLTIDAFATGTTNGAYTDPQALANTLKLVNGTTAVAIETRQFFVGGAPSAAGLAYLVNSTTNANDLNDAYYAKFSAENRFINFSINLATGTGEGAAAFAAAYGGTGVSYEQTVRTAYDKIIGNSVATAAGVDVEATVKFFSRAENITYLTNFVKANTGYTTASDIDLAVKAALIGEILNAATGAGLGAYATATSSMILDLSDGTLDTDNSAGVNLFTAYPGGGVAGTVYKLAPNADTVTGTAANDTINAFTVDATGANASTLTAFDNIDGGNGTDTLNIYTDTANTFNTTIASTATIKNVEVINIFNQSGAGAVGTSGNVEANLFQGAKEIWQSGTAVASVQGVSQGQTIGFGSTATNFNVAVGAAAAATSVTIALKDAHENSQIVVQPVNIANNGVTSVTVTGNLVDSDGDGTVDPLFLGLAAAKNASSVTINTAVDVNLQVAEQAGSTKSINTVDASASKGAISFIGDAATNTIKTGSGADFVVTTAATLKDDAATSGVDETFNASVATGAGADIVIVNTTGTGATSVDTGTGDDAISLASRGSGKLTVVLGDGNDSFAAGGGTVNATDSIDGGAGLDTLTLSLVGSANIGAFSNFEVFDVADLGNNLDIDILASKNTVTEIIGSDSLNGNQTLSNVGAGVGFRATADMGTDRLTLTQKTAGALTVTLDSDEASADSAGNTNEVAVTASNATSLNAVFASDYKDALSSVTNTTTINLTGSAAASVAVTSGGAESLNVLNLTSATNGATGRYFLTSVTVTGADHLTLDVTNAGRSIAAGTITETAALTSVDASASTGGLAFDLNDMRVSTTYANIVKLGSGDDVLVGHIGTDAAGVLTAAGSYGVAVQNYEAASGSGAATAQGFDVFSIAGATVANDKTGAGVYVMEDGHIAFSGAGPATLADALVIANTAAESVGETAFFEYLGSTYLFTQGGTVANEDSTIKLVGTTGLHGVDLVGGAGGAVYLY